MEGKGMRGIDARVEWPELMRFKRTFTDPVPEEREKSFAKAGIDSFHGVARFTSSNQLQVGEEIIESRRFLIAAGASVRGRRVHLL
jgi:glutathione reductase (NADPH)